MKVSFEFLHVEPKCTSMALELIVGERVLVAQQVVMHLPESVLGSGRLGSQGGSPRVRVLADQREVAENEDDTVPEHGQQFLYAGQRFGTEGALIVAILDQLHDGVLPPDAVIPIVDRRSQSQSTVVLPDARVGYIVGSQYRLPDHFGATSWVVVTQVPSRSKTYSDPAQPMTAAAQRGYSMAPSIAVPTSPLQSM
jgi:hypothetical protein